MLFHFIFLTRTRICKAYLIKHTTKADCPVAPSNSDGKSWPWRWPWPWLFHTDPLPLAWLVTLHYLAWQYKYDGKILSVTLHNVDDLKSNKKGVHRILYFKVEMCLQGKDAPLIYAGHKIDLWPQSVSLTLKLGVWFLLNIQGW